MQVWHTILVSLDLG